MKDIARRLERLEGGDMGAPQWPDPRVVAIGFLQRAILAVWKGGLGDHESIAQGHARATGFGTYEAYKVALWSDADDEWTERHNAAWRRLLAEHGIGPASRQEEIDAVLANLLQRVPARVQTMIREKFEAIEAVIGI